MNVNVSIIDDELVELNTIIAEILKDNPQSPITAAQYVQNIIDGFFKARIKNKYLAHAKELNIGTLKQKFGKVEDL